MSKSRPAQLRLEQRPSPLLPLVLAGTLSVLTLTAFAAAAVVQVDQILMIPGKLVTRRGTQVVSSSQAGVVKHVLVKEGTHVRAGEALVVLDPKVQRSDVSELAMQLTAEASRLEAEKQGLQAKIEGLEKAAAIDLKVLEPLQRLSKEGASQLLETSVKEKEYEATKRELAESRQALLRVGFESERQQAVLRRELTGARSHLELVTLRAPVAGTVLGLKALSGEVVNGGTALLNLVPSDDLQVQGVVRNHDLAFIKPGQLAQIGITAYDPSLYGNVPGRVLTIGEDALPPDNNYNYPHFPVVLTLDRQDLALKGKHFELQPGMEINAQINLQKRTILNLFFSRLNRGAGCCSQLSLACG